MSALAVASLVAAVADPGSDSFFAALLALSVALAVGQLLTPFVDYMQNAIGRDIRVTVQGNVMTQVNAFTGLERFENPDFHDELRLAQQGGQQAPAQAVIVGTSVLRQGVTLGGLLVALNTVSTGAALLTTLSVIPVLYAELRASKARVRAAFTLSPAERRGLFYSGLQTDAQAAKEIRIFGLGDFFRERMSAEYRSIAMTERRLARRALRLHFGLGVVAVVLAIIALVVALDVNSGSPMGAQAGGVALAISAVTGVQVASVGIVSGIAQLTESLGIFTAYHSLMSSREVSQMPALRVAEPLTAEVIFEDVWFRYSDDADWALAGLNLKLRAGETLAVVGENGSGKSTLIKLLCRFYEPDHGRVLWDGQDISSMNPQSLRRRLTSVFQDFVEYEMTAYENIALGDLAHLDDPTKAQNAAVRAGADAFVRDLHDGYDTMLSRTFDGLAGSHGSELSGGQWQKLAVARALMQPGEVLLLDEASSRLDPAAELRLFSELSQTATGATRLLVSHRWGTVRSADRIVVMAKGAVVEEGSHAELMARKGPYADTFAAQARQFS